MNGLPKEVAKELADIRELIQEVTQRLNSFTDMRDDSNLQEIENTQVGLTEAYESAVTTAEGVTNVEIALTEVYEMLLGGEV